MLRFERKIVREGQVERVWRSYSIQHTPQQQPAHPTPCPVTGSGSASGSGSSGAGMAGAAGFGSGSGSGSGSGCGCGLAREFVTISFVNYHTGKG